MVEVSSGDSTNQHDELLAPLDPIEVWLVEARSDLRRRG